MLEQHANEIPDAIDVDSTLARLYSFFQPPLIDSGSTLAHMGTALLRHQGSRDEIVSIFGATYNRHRRMRSDV